MTIVGNSVTGPCKIYAGQTQIFTPWVSTKDVAGGTVTGNTGDLVFSEGGDTNVTFSKNALAHCVN